MKRTFGLGLACAETDTPIDMGYSHPSAHGGLRIHCEIDGEIITTAEIEIGFMHRGVEELFVARDYRQGVMLASRHDWSGPSGGELAYSLAIEELLGLVAPPRASRLRVLLAELDRIVSALTFLSAVPNAGCASIQHAITSHRERISDTLESITGARMHHQVIKVGGMAIDLGEHSFVRISGGLRALADEITSWQSAFAVSLAPYRGIGVLSRDVAIAHGASGIIARASSVPLDVRIAQPYASYSEVQHLLESANQFTGDIPSRISLLFHEVIVSSAIVNEVISRLRASAGEPIAERTPKALRLPEGEVYRNVEGSLGINGVALFSNGGRSPNRLRLRTASFGNLSALAPTLTGLAVRDLPMMLASWPFLSGDSDR